jgi:hypothetical protein
MLSHPTPQKRFLRELDREVAAHTEAGAAAFRAAAEEALVAAGLHVAEGARLWEAFRWAGAASRAAQGPACRGA